MTTVNPRMIQVLILAKALEMYAATTMKVNRDYTPANMLRTATRLTGKKYKRGQYLAAVTDLRSLI
jgi:hypothetical protein